LESSESQGLSYLILRIINQIIRFLSLILR